MPKYWYDWHSVRIREEDSDEEIDFKKYQQTIIADKKPYFMQYIYPEERKKYLEYMCRTKEKCIARFGINLETLLNKEEKDSAEKKFIDIYKQLLPLNDNNCVLNRICHKIENEIGEFKKKKPKNFDYNILKKENVEYSEEEYNSILDLYKKYQKSISDYMVKAKNTRIKDEDRIMQKFVYLQEFERLCSSAVPNEDTLCNILIDICYSRTNNSKQFVWDMCGNKIVKNIVSRNGGIVFVPELDKDGDIEFGGNKYSMKEEMASDYFE